MFNCQGMKWTLSCCKTPQERRRLKTKPETEGNGRCGVLEQIMFIPYGLQSQWLMVCENICGAANGQILEHRARWREENSPSDVKPSTDRILGDSQLLSCDGLQ